MPAPIPNKEFFTKLIATRHPLFRDDFQDWDKWRLTYEGGDAFLEEYTKKFSKRESNQAFADRKSITPIFGYSKIAVNRVRNAIFQRMGDITRRGGSRKYHESASGERGGVDRRGSSMNFFLGNKVLTDLLVMGRFGVYVDSPKARGQGTMADTMMSKPYLYGYRIEDILSWTNSNPEDPNEFQSLLLRDVDLEVDPHTQLPIDKVLRYRWVYIDEASGFVNVQFISRDGEPEELNELTGLTRIPFHMFDIGGALMKDICNHQVTLLNIDSANVSYNILSNFPFYTEKRAKYGQSGHLKPEANADGTATAGGQGANEETVEIGNMTARTYIEEAGRFIAPPAEPLEVSLKLRNQLTDDIDRLVSLRVMSMGGGVENEGLESGLAFIANVLETGERRIADFWAIYEKSTPATIKYPDRFSLKSEAERIEDSNNLSKLMYAVPGRTIKKELAKSIVSTLLSGKVSSDTMQTINSEIDDSPFCTSDPSIVEMAMDKGLVGTKTASISLGYPDDEHERAEEDRARRIALTREAQTTGEIQNPAARGVPDEAPAPQQEASEEKELSRETDEEDTPEDRVRGEAE